MKRIVVLLLAVSLLFTFCSCANTNQEEVATGPVITESDELTTENKIDETLPTEEPTVAVRPYDEWGFEDLEELGYGVVQITEYNLKEGYVIYSGEYTPDVTEIKNGYFLGCRWNGNKFVPWTTQRYETISNDILYVVNDGNFSITERKTIPGKDFVVLKNQIYTDDGALIYESWHIPYSLIDWEKGVEEIDGSDKYSYKFYLK